MSPFHETKCKQKSINVSVLTTSVSIINDYILLNFRFRQCILINKCSHEFVEKTWLMGKIAHISGGKRFYE